LVLDAYSRMIVGWQLAGHMRTGVVLDALRMALHRRGPGARRRTRQSQRPGLAVRVQGAVATLLVYWRIVVPWPVVLAPVVRLGCALAIAEAA
jgi:transposase InsO family protein